MNDISKVDRNFYVSTDIKKDDIKFFDVDKMPFKIYGIFKENGKYRRIPESIAASVSEGVSLLHTNTAGGRVRFKTDSEYIAICAQMDGVSKMNHFAMTGSAGFDLYADDEYAGTFVPPGDIENGYDSIVEFNSSKMREITINFPLYSNVKNLYIGISESATINEASPYKNTKPIVYYGSSITQGGCASRPGMSYQSILSRRLNLNYINLGFSGSAKAENAIASYIKILDMSAFVYDYDHNAPTAEYLALTHEKMFKAIREENPMLPIILMSRPKYKLTNEEKERRDIIKTTYSNAVFSGDKNVYFADGAVLTELCGNEGTVDNCHPTDFGFISIAKALENIISGIDLI